MNDDRPVATDSAARPVIIADHHIDEATTRSARTTMNRPGLVGRLFGRANVFGSKKIRRARNSKLDADDIRALLDGFRSRMDVFDGQLTDMENSELDADEHAPWVSRRDLHGVVALRANRLRTELMNTRDSRPNKETMSMRLKWLEKRTNRISGIMNENAGYSKWVARNKPGFMNRMKSGVHAFRNKTKTPRNLKRAMGNMRVMTNRLKSRVYAFGKKTKAIPNSKRATKNKPGLMKRMKNRVSEFIKKLKATRNSKRNDVVIRNIVVTKDTPGLMDRLKSRVYAFRQNMKAKVVENRKRAANHMRVTTTRLKDRLLAYGKSTVLAGNSNLRRMTSRVYAFCKKTKAARNAKLDADGKRVLLDKFKSRLDAIEVELAAIEKWKRDGAAVEPGLTSRLGSRVIAFGQRTTKAVANRKRNPNADRHWLRRLDGLADTADRVCPLTPAEPEGHRAAVRPTESPTESRVWLAVATMATDAGGDRSPCEAATSISTCAAGRSSADDERRESRSADERNTSVRSGDDLSYWPPVSLNYRRSKRALYSSNKPNI